ncbi:tetratricopeptide repeat protein [Gemmatimonadota bacterium]
MTESSSERTESPGPSAESLGSRLQRAWIWQICIALVAGALFARTFGFGWIYDDQLEIVRNTLVHTLERIPEIFTSTVWAGSGMETYLYRPLALVTYALNHQISGLDPWSYHLVNIFLHAAVSVLVFRVGRLWGLTTVAAGVGGLLFALHPVHVEVAAAVFGRKDLLAAFFTLSVILTHRSALARGGWLVVLPVVAYGAALFSKEVGAVAFGLVVAHDFLLEPGRRKLLRNPRVPRLYIAYLGTALLYLLLRNHVTGGVGVPQTSFFDNPLVGADLFSRVATALVIVGKGVFLLAVPVTLSPDYSFDAIPLVESFLDVRFVFLLAASGGLAWWVVARRRTGGLVVLALAWYAITLLPGSNLLVTVGTIFGERLLYLPSVSFCLLAGAGVGWLSRHHVRVVLVGTALWAAGLAVQTVRYVGAWDNDIRLFQWAVAHVPESTKAHHKLGEELLRVGRLGDAVRSLRTALEIAPENEFAAVTMALAKRQISERYLPPATEREEAGGPLPPRSPSDPDLLYVLGLVSQERGDLEEAEAYLHAVLDNDGEHPEALGALGLLRALQADTANALSYLLRAVESKPSLANAWFNLGRLHLARGDVQEAGEALQQFLAHGGSRYPDQAEWARGTLAELDVR